MATFPVSLAKAPTSTRPQEAQIFIRMVETGGRAVERKLVLPIAPQAALIGVKPLFGDKSVAEGDKAEFDVLFVGVDGKQLPRDGLRYELLKMEVALSMVPARTRRGNTSRSSRPSASPMAT